MADFEVPRQKMDFSSRYIHFSALLMGLSFFFRCLYYLGLNDIGSFGKGEVFLFLALPLLLCGTYIAMTAVIKINIPLIYCSLGVLICVMVILWSFSTASVARILLSILCYGGFAFAAVFMATDPVTGARTDIGKFIYGFLIGVFAILIRIYNGGFPEGAMLAVLLMNAFAPTIDHCVVSANIKRRLNRAKAK